MTNLGNENLRDGETVKKRAQAIKARLKDLGHEIPLTHAYEALATACGVRNWPTLKAQLDSSTSVGSSGESSREREDFSTAAFFDADGQRWSGYLEKQPVGYEFVYGPPGKGKTSLSWALDMMRLEAALAAEPNALPRMTIIDLDGASKSLVEQMKGRVPRDTSHRIRHIRIKTDRSQSINIFDTPVGQRFPSRAQRDALASFLAAILGEENHETKQMALRAIDGAYSRRAFTADRSKGGEAARPYLLGEVRELDAYVGTMPHRHEALTWWEVVDASLKEGKIKQAVIAQRHAVPRLCDLSSVLDDIARLEVKAETRDLAIRMRVAFERHIHTFPLLSHVTDPSFSLRPNIVGVDLSEFSRQGNDTASRDLGLVFLVVRQFFAGRHFGVSPARDTDGLLVYDDIHRLPPGCPALAQIEVDLRERTARGVDIRISSQRLAALGTDILGLASRVYLLGNPSKKELDLGFVFGLKSEWMERCEVELVGPTQGRLPFVVLQNGSQPLSLTMRLDPEAIWSAATAPDDIRLRNGVADHIGESAATKALGKRFRSGSCGFEVDRRMAIHMAAGYNPDLLAEIRLNVIDSLADEIAALSAD
jgi:intracellular multiplication protein IcmB